MTEEEPATTILPLTLRAGLCLALGASAFLSGCSEGSQPSAAADAAACECAGVAFADAVGLFNHSLAFRAQDEVEEVLCFRAHVCKRCHVEGAGDLIGAVLDVFRSCIHAVDLQRLDGVVQGAEGDIADRSLVAGDGLHHDGGAVGHFGGLNGVIDLFARFVLLLNAEQLDERAARAGAFFTGDDIDRGGFGSLAAACSKGKQHQCRESKCDEFLHCVISFFLLLFSLSYGYIIRCLG